ncbi:hypothetical protein E2C01_006772 [Portunus trituberculatus]|uniref:Uncharacterized protein n=1 Tax=Portunus trituberculatus TaxID=210409 RepID=A0A5B7CX77_PORTR|nr:hypothetical protein [Portunus trituberculatus]
MSDLHTALHRRWREGFGFYRFFARKSSFYRFFFSSDLLLSSHALILTPISPPFSTRLPLSPMTFLLRPPLAVTPASSLRNMGQYVSLTPPQRVKLLRPPPPSSPSYPPPSLPPPSLPPPLLPSRPQTTTLPLVK